MRAAVGDTIQISGHRFGQPRRQCRVVGVRRLDGEPPYVVRWADTGAEDLYYPGGDAAVVSSEANSEDDDDAWRIGPFAWDESYCWGYH